MAVQSYAPAAASTEQADLWKLACAEFNASLIGAVRLTPSVDAYPIFVGPAQLASGTQGWHAHMMMPDHQATKAGRITAGEEDQSP